MASERKSLRPVSSGSTLWLGVRLKPGEPRVPGTAMQAQHVETRDADPQERVAFRVLWVMFIN
jgi:hypothetical protein